MKNSRKEEIVEFAKKIFLKEGFYKTSLDQIALQFHISKKTIYKYFPSKQKLVEEVILSFIRSHSEEIDQIVDQRRDAVTKLCQFLNYLANMLQQVGEKWFEDIQSNFPELLQEIDELRTKQLTKSLSKIIQQGKQENFFVELPDVILITILVSSIKGIVNPVFMKQSNIPIGRSLEITTKFIVNSIMNERAKKIFKDIKFGVNK